MIILSLPLYTCCASVCLQKHVRLTRGFETAVRAALSMSALNYSTAFTYSISDLHEVRWAPSAPVSSSSLITSTFWQPACLLRTTTNEVPSIRIIAKHNDLKDRNTLLMPNDSQLWPGSLVCKKMKIAIDATSTISILFGVTLYGVRNVVSIDTFQSSVWWFNDGLSWRRHLRNHIRGLADLAGTLDFSCHVKMFLKLKSHLLIPVFHRVL